MAINEEKNVKESFVYLHLQLEKQSRKTNKQFTEQGHYLLASTECVKAPSDQSPLRHVAPSNITEAVRNPSTLSFFYGIMCFL